MCSSCSSIPSTAVLDCASLYLHKTQQHNSQQLFSSKTIEEREKRLDDDYTYEFMFKTLDNESITYTQKVVNNRDETLAEIRRNDADFDLYIVGRGEKTRSVLTSGLSDWNSCQELGTMGDTLASSNFTSHASVLVVSDQVPFGNTTSISHHYVYDQDEDDGDDYNYDYDYDYDHNRK